MNSLWMAAIGRPLRQDSLSVLRSTQMRLSDRFAIMLCCISYQQMWLGWTLRPNRQVLAPLLRGFDLITAGYHPPHHYTFISYVTIHPYSGLASTIRALAEACDSTPNGNARDFDEVFAFGNLHTYGCCYLCTTIASKIESYSRSFPSLRFCWELLIGFVMRRFRVSHSWISKSNRAIGESVTRLSAKKPPTRRILSGCNGRDGPSSAQKLACHMRPRVLITPREPFATSPPYRAAAGAG